MVEKTSSIATTNELVVDRGVFNAVALKEKTYLTTKRIFDVVASAIAIILASPIFLITSLAILTTDFGPVFYTQNRIGKGGKLFKIYKFRSMKTNSNEILEDLLKDPKIKREWTRNHKLNNDPRITKIGKIIRRFSIDELPQLFNVLKGDMSIVGNRPYMDSEKKAMGKSYYSILDTKPGITGVWQTSGRNNLSFKNRLKLEEEYSYNCSIKSDTRIILKTFSAVLGHNGAK